MANVCLSYAPTTQLCITNSFFMSKLQHKFSWRHPRSKHWHQLDLVLVRHKAIKNVINTHAYHSADCDTDHTSICCRLKLQPKKFYNTKSTGKARINVSLMPQPEHHQRLSETFQNVYKAPAASASATEARNTLRDSVHHAAVDTFGKQKRRSPDWFEAKATQIIPIIEANRSALIRYKQLPTRNNLLALRTARRCANEYWVELSNSIQQAADTGNARGMYEGIKKALGPTSSKSAPLKAKSGILLTDKAQQMERWVEHYSELYSRQNVVTPSALDATVSLPPLDDLDAEPTMDKLRHAIKQLKSAKAPGTTAFPLIC